MELKNIPETKSTLICSLNYSQLSSLYVTFIISLDFYPQAKSQLDRGSLKIAWNYCHRLGWYAMLTS